jgi:hypothetical protein
MLRWMLRGMLRCMLRGMLRGLLLGRLRGMLLGLRGMLLGMLRGRLRCLLRGLRKSNGNDELWQRCLTRHLEKEDNDMEQDDSMLDLALIVLDIEEEDEPLLILGPGGDYVDIYYPEHF